MLESSSLRPAMNLQLNPVNYENTKQLKNKICMYICICICIHRYYICNQECVCTVYNTKSLYWTFEKLNPQDSPTKYFKNRPVSVDHLHQNWKREIRIRTRIIKKIKREKY